ncbi:GNAT family N-acetyltransferase [Pseudalkalibacillus decolorationis]|uniref:GNAT family N-acetyltransferase n=1 Tax=Pseudalkalibacillus decolorationis TaxID=163879 RepID=UPI002148BB01|nr:GNAT family N-acetyltransferase [Pseudalkalibacillus decolorationis]
MKMSYYSSGVIDRAYAGQEIGLTLMKWAETYTSEIGRNRVRFDCVAHNDGLNKYYQKRYPLQGVLHDYGEHCKYEKVVQVTSVA